MPSPDVVQVVDVGDREAVVRQDEFGMVMVVELQGKSSFLNSESSSTRHQERLTCRTPLLIRKAINLLRRQY
jgi:hypothetical protein